MGWERAASAHGDTRVAIMSGPTSTCRPSSDAYLHRIHTWTFHVNTVSASVKVRTTSSEGRLLHASNEFHIVVEPGLYRACSSENFPGDRDSSCVNFNFRKKGVVEEKVILRDVGKYTMLVGGCKICLIRRLENDVDLLDS